MKKTKLLTLLLLLSLTLGICACSKQKDKDVHSTPDTSTVTKAPDNNPGVDDTPDNSAEDIQEETPSSSATVTAENLLKDFGNTFASAGFLDFSSKLTLDYDVKDINRRITNTEISETTIQVDETLDLKFGNNILFFDRNAVTNVYGEPLEQAVKAWVTAEPNDSKYYVAKWDEADHCWYLDYSWDSEVGQKINSIKNIFKSLDQPIYKSLSLETKEDTYVVTAIPELEKLLQLDNRESDEKSEYFRPEFFEGFTFDLNLIFTFDKTTKNLRSLSLKPDTLDFISSDSELYFDEFVCELTINEISNAEFDVPDELIDCESSPKEDVTETWDDFELFSYSTEGIPFLIQPVSAAEYVERTGDISENWTDLEFILDGKLHKLGDPLFSVLGTWQPEDLAELEEADPYYDFCSFFLKRDNDYNSLYVNTYNPEYHTSESGGIPNKNRNIYEIHYTMDSDETPCDFQIAGFKMGAPIETVTSALGERTKITKGGETLYQYYSDYGRSYLGVTCEDGIITGLDLRYNISLY